MFSKKHTHGGANRNQGRHPSGYISKLVRMSFQDEKEYQEFIKTYLDCRERVLAVKRGYSMLDIS